MTSNNTLEPPSAGRVPPAARRAAIAGMVGTFIEYYDYMLFGVLTVYLAPQFFPASDPSVSILLGLAVYGTGYFAKPIGGIVFGRLGDRRGRRATLLATVAMMGLSATLIGVLPGYATIGVAAPILLVALRLCQGMSSGAEMQGAITHAIESAPRGRRAALGSFVQLGCAAGTATGALTAALLGGLLGQAVMRDWGWRVPFLIVIPLTLIAFALRRRLEDSPEFRTLVEKNQIAATPLRTVFSVHRGRLLVATAYAFGMTAFSGLLSWVVPYLSGVRQLPATTVFLCFGIASMVAAFTTPLGGVLTDRFGHRRLGASLLVLILVLAPPLFWALGTVTDPVPLTLIIVVFITLINVSAVPLYTYLSELFPPAVRLSGASLAANVGTVLGGGLGPLVATALVLSTGSVFGPLVWLGLGGVCALLALGGAGRLSRYPGQAVGDERAHPRTPTATGAPTG